MHSMVEGRFQLHHPLITNLDYAPNDRVQIFKHEFCGDPGRGNTFTSQETRTCGILAPCIWCFVCLAINFDCEFCPGTEKIQHIRACRMLAAELVVTGTRAQGLP